MGKGPEHPTPQTGEVQHARRNKIIVPFIGFTARADILPTWGEEQIKNAQEKLIERRRPDSDTVAASEIPAEVQDIAAIMYALLDREVQSYEPSPDYSYGVVIHGLKTTHDFLQAVKETYKIEHLGHVYDVLVKNFGVDQNKGE